MSFKVGDTVQYKSGGPNMTITDVYTEHGTDYLTCKWFSKQKGEFFVEQNVKPAAVQKPPEPPM